MKGQRGDGNTGGLAVTLKEELRLAGSEIGHRGYPLALKVIHP
jgi:hypothetical protein